MKQIITAFLLSLRQQYRNRIALVLMFVIPTVFFAVTLLTTKDVNVLFKLASTSEDTLIEVNQRFESLIFMALSAGGLLAAFLGLMLVHQDSEPSKRLVLCGYPVWSIICGKLLLLITLLCLIALYMTLFVVCFYRPEHIAGLYIGLSTLGYVYGAYGMLIGAVVRRQLEGIFLIALLVNIDVGWLQNPLFYSDAMNRAIIRFLPAFYPAQVAMIQAFSDYGIGRPLYWGVVYGSVFLVAAIFFYYQRVKCHRSSSPVSIA